MTYICAQLLQSCPTLCKPMDHQRTSRLLCPLDCLGKSTGVGCLHFREKKKPKELLPLLSQPPHKPVSNQGLGVGKGQGLIHSKINKKKLAQDVEETKKLQETEGKRERQEG